LTFWQLLMNFRNDCPYQWMSEWVRVFFYSLHYTYQQVLCILQAHKMTQKSFWLCSANWKFLLLGLQTNRQVLMPAKVSKAKENEKNRKRSESSRIAAWWVTTWITAYSNALMTSVTWGDRTTPPGGWMTPHTDHYHTYDIVRGRLLTIGHGWHNEFCYSIHCSVNKTSARGSRLFLLGLFVRLLCSSSC